MEYRALHVPRDREDQKGESFAMAVQEALNQADREGFEVLSIVPVENSGFTVGVVIATRQRTA